MILRFHMQHDKAAGLQKNKSQAARKSNKAAVAKITKPLKSAFLLNHLIYLAKILYRALVAPRFIRIFK